MKIIIGAGLSGLSSGYHLKMRGVNNFLILESNDRVGGLCKTEKESGFLFDYTGHYLHLKNEYTQNLIKELLGSNLESHERMSWIFLNNKLTHYPFQMNTYGLPLKSRIECLTGLLSRKKNIELRTFKDWVLKYFGYGIGKYFLFPYNEKLWTVEAEKLLSDWTDRFVPKINIKEFIAGMFSSQKNIGYNAFFYYPKNNGIESLPKAFESHLKHKISKNTKVVRIDSKKRIVETSDGKTLEYETLIPSLPLPELIKITSGLPRKMYDFVENMDFVSVYNLNIGLNTQIRDDFHWIYFPEKQYPFYRIGSVSNIEKNTAPIGCSSIYTEVSYSRHRPLPKQIDEKIINGLAKSGFLSNENEIIVRKPIDIKYAYVLYNKEWKITSEIKEYLKRIGIYTIGRYGTWDYSSMEDAIIEGKILSENLTCR